MAEQTSPSIQQLFDEKTKLRNKLMKERDAVKASIKASPEYLALQERENGLEKQYAVLDKQMDKVLKEIRLRFLTDGSDWVSYCSRDNWRVSRGTNIYSHVLSAIAKVTPLSKLTDENVKDAVKELMALARRKHAGLQKLYEQARPLRVEHDAVRDKRWAMERSEQVSELDHQIVSLAIELQSLEEKLQHPEPVQAKDEKGNLLFYRKSGEPRMLWTPKHLDMYARRKTVKMFLSAVWETWRRMNGRPVETIYPIAYLGHKHHIPAEKWMEKRPVEDV